MSTTNTSPQLVTANISKFKNTTSNALAVEVSGGTGTYSGSRMSYDSPVQAFTVDNQNNFYALTETGFYKNLDLLAPLNAADTYTSPVYHNNEVILLINGEVNVFDPDTGNFGPLGWSVSSLEGLIASKGILYGFKEDKLFTYLYREEASNYTGSSLGVEIVNIFNLTSHQGEEMIILTPEGFGSLSPELAYVPIVNFAPLIMGNPTFLAGESVKMNADESVHFSTFWLSTDDEKLYVIYPESAFTPSTVILETSITPGPGLRTDNKGCLTFIGVGTENTQINFHDAGYEMPLFVSALANLNVSPMGSRSMTMSTQNSPYEALEIKINRYNYDNKYTSYLNTVRLYADTNSQDCPDSGNYSLCYKQLIAENGSPQCISIHNPGNIFTPNAMRVELGDSDDGIVIVTAMDLDPYTNPVRPH